MKAKNRCTILTVIGCPFLTDNVEEAKAVLKLIVFKENCESSRATDTQRALASGESLALGMLLKL